MNNTTKKDYFLSQPHQPFFAFGSVSAILVMLIFFLNYKGILTLELDTLNFHIYSLVFIVFTNMFTGFLFTTFPRFCQYKVISKDYYTNLFYLNIASSLLFLVGSFSSYILLTIGIFGLFLSHIFIIKKLYEIYKNGNTINKKDAFWILNAHFLGLVGHLLFLFIAVNHYLNIDIYLLKTATNISFYLYLIFLAFSVAQRMIPFFSHSFVTKDKDFVTIIFTLFVLKTIFSTFYIKEVEIVIDILLASYMFIEFKRWELKPLNSPPILWVLHLSLFWLPTAFLLSAISLMGELILDTSFYYLNIHLLALGFLTTILIGFGTRVTLGHSGQPPQADKLTKNLFLFTQVIVILRALYSFDIAFGWGANFLFDITFTAWLALFLAWSFIYGKVLIFGSKINSSLY